MDDPEIKRIALILSEKYGKKALPKAVDAARKYTEEGDRELAKQWVSIGYAIKEIQGLKTSPADYMETEDTTVS